MKIKNGMKFEYYDGCTTDFVRINDKYTDFIEISDYQNILKELIDTIDDKNLLDEIVQVILSTKGNCEVEVCGQCFDSCYEYILEI